LLISFGFSNPQILLPEKVSKNLIQFNNGGNAILLLKTLEELKKDKVNNWKDRANFQLIILQNISKLYDPKFPENAPTLYTNVMPPMGYDSGVSPNEVKDPTQKKDYEKRISENAKNQNDAKIQKAIRNLISDMADSISKLEPMIQKEFKSNLRIQDLPAPLKAIVLTVVEEKIKVASRIPFPTGGVVMPK
jgi:hypothetical protein